MQLIKPDININFVGRRYLAMIVSGLLILAAVASVIIQGGLNFGIDFVGGVHLRVRFEKPVTIPQIRKALAPLGMSDSVIQKFEEIGQAKPTYIIRSEKTELKLDQVVNQIKKAFGKSFGAAGFNILSSETVGPKVGRDLREKALGAMFFALILISIYISGRFQGAWLASTALGLIMLLLAYFVLVVVQPSETVIAISIVLALALTLAFLVILGLKFALGALVALIHDVLITVGVFSVTGMEFTLSIVAALLTIIGYSLNDTIVVFDRIRENFKKTGRFNQEEVINRSINDTLSRTILTSGTTLAVLLSLYILGGGVIKDFAFALIVGVVVGTYSSVYVASPILLLWKDEKAAKADRKATNAKAAPAKVKRQPAKAVKKAKAAKTAEEPAPEAKAAPQPAAQKKTAQTVSKAKIKKASGPKKKKKKKKKR